MTQPSGKDLWNSLSGWGGGGSGTTTTTTPKGPPGGVYQINGQWYNIKNEPIDSSGRVIKDEAPPKYSEQYFRGGPQGPGWYTVNPDGTPGTLVQLDTNTGGGSGSVSEIGRAHV